MTLKNGKKCRYKFLKMLLRLEKYFEQKFKWQLSSIRNI